MDKHGRIQADFPGENNPFTIERFLCDNSDCPIYHLQFREVATKPFTFNFSYNACDLSKSDTHDKSARAESLKKIFLENLPENIQQSLVQDFQENKQGLVNIQNCILPVSLISDGKLVSYSEIEAGVHAMADPVDNQMKLYPSFSVEYNGDEYLICDMYCPTPKCRCNEVIVQVFKCVKDESGEQVRHETPFMAYIPFESKARIIESDAIDHHSALKFISHWLRKNPHTKGLLKFRYHQVKKIGKKSLAHAQTQLAAKFPDQTKAGRNDPCPCGSGKKLKKCCSP